MKYANSLSVRDCNKLRVRSFANGGPIPCNVGDFGRSDLELSMTQSIYDAVGGWQAFVKLAHAWHARCLADPVVSHAFSHGFHPQHTERLAAYWAEALGGPSNYTTSLGSESEVTRIHSGNGDHLEMDEQAQICFAQALDDANIPDDSRLRNTLKSYFRWAIERMSAYPESSEDVPDELAMAHWSWDGPV